MEVLQRVLPKVRAALGKKDYQICDVGETREEEAEKGATRLTITATLRLCEGAECIEKVLEVEVYQINKAGNAPASAVLRKLTTLSTTTKPRPESPLDKGAAQHSPSPAGVPATTEEEQEASPPDADPAPGTLQPMPTSVTPDVESPPATPGDPVYRPECSGLADSDGLQGPEATASSSSLLSRFAAKSIAGLAGLTPLASTSPTAAVTPPSPSLMALLAASLRSLRPPPPSPGLSPGLPAALPPVVLALLQRRGAAPAPPLPLSTAGTGSPPWPASPSLRPNAGRPISQPLARHLARLLEVRRTPSLALSRLLQKRPRHACGLEEPVAKRLRISTESVPLDPEDIVQTPYGGVACNHLVDMLVATLSALDCTTPIGLRHRRCVQWTVAHQPHHTLHPGYLQAPVQTLSLREQLMLQRGCTTAYRKPDPLRSPEKPLQSPSRSPGDPLDLPPEFLEEEPEALPPLSLSPPRTHATIPATPEVATPTKPTSGATTSTPTSSSKKTTHHPWSTLRSYHATHAKVSPKKAASSPVAALGALPSAKRAQMKALLDKKLAVLHATFKRYKEQSAELLKSPAATPTQRQEALKRIKDITEDIKRTLEQQKQLTQPPAGPPAKHIPGLTLLDPSHRPSTNLGAGEAVAAPGRASPPPPATAAPRPKEELQQKVETVVREMKDTWDMDEDLLFK